MRDLKKPRKILYKMSVIPTIRTLWVLSALWWCAGIRFIRTVVIAIIILHSYNRSGTRAIQTKTTRFM